MLSYLCDISGQRRAPRLEGLDEHQTSILVVVANVTSATKVVTDLSSANKRDSLDLALAVECRTVHAEQGRG